MRNHMRGVKRRKALSQNGCGKINGVMRSKANTKQDTQQTEYVCVTVYID